MPSSFLLFPGNNSIKFKTKMANSLLAKRHFVDRASLLTFRCFDLKHKFLRILLFGVFCNSVFTRNGRPVFV